MEKYNGELKLNMTPDGEFDFAGAEEEREKKEQQEEKSWREINGEQAYANLMLNHKIGPALWDYVVVDKEGNVISVKGQPYKEWNAFYNSLEEGGPDTPYSNYNKN